MLNKGCFIVLFCMIIVMQGFAQEGKKGKITYPQDWHMLSVANDGIHGVGIYNAYDYLKNRQPKRKVIVAVLDSGIDPGHEDLKTNLWVNRDEVPDNGIDDDGNGYVDDVHGWNFLGLPDGKQVESLSLEADREFLRLQEKFKNADTNRLSKKELELYHFYDKKVITKSPIGSSYKGIDVARNLVAYAEEFDKEMKLKFPGEKLGIKHYKSIISRDEKDIMRAQAHFYYMFGWSRTPNASWDNIFKVRLQLIGEAEKRYAKARGVEMNQRDSIGDNILDLEDRFHGNNRLKAKGADHGTHVAGIIGADRGNGHGIDGIADVELMVLRVTTGNGDEYDKDVVNAIRYAVANGANIINMSIGKFFSPEQKWVNEVMKLAEKKGILIVHGAGNNSVSIDEETFYPAKRLPKKKELSNFINVGASDPEGSPAIFSNYGKENVDLFAPGTDIYSTIQNGNYKKVGGTSMATPVVSGIAALVWNYFPELTVKQLKRVLLESVTPQGKVLKPQPRAQATPRLTVPFSDLCTTGGIINARKAIELAEKIVNK